MAERLEILARDPERRAEMGEAGRERVLARYAVERLVDDVDALYRELLDDHVGDEAPVALERDLAVGLALDPRPAALPHPLERSAALDHIADRARDELRTPRRHDDAAPDLLDEPHRLAVGVGRDEHRPPAARMPYSRLGTTKPERPRARPT